MHHSPPEVASENLEIFVGGLFEGAGPALTTVLNRHVTVAVTDVTAITPAELLRAEPLPWVLVEMGYQRGLMGGHWLILPLPTALTFGQALMGESGGASELLAVHDEAIRDAVNQILISAGQTLMPLLARAVAFAPVTVRAVESEDDLPPELAPDAPGFWLARASASGPGGFALELAVTIDRTLADEISAVGAGTGGVPDEAAAPESAPGAAGAKASSRLDLIMDVSLTVTVELGRARMLIQDIVRLAPGSVIELDKSAGDPVELFINDRPIAKGEVVVIDENFGVRLTSIVTPSERIKTLR